MLAGLCKHDDLKQSSMCCPVILIKRTSEAFAHAQKEPMVGDLLYAVCFLANRRAVFTTYVITITPQPLKTRRDKDGMNACVGHIIKSSARYILIRHFARSRVYAAIGAVVL